MPEFFTKQSNLGIMGIILVGGLFAGNKMFAPVKENIKINDIAYPVPVQNIKIQTVMDIPKKEKQDKIDHEIVSMVKNKECMFWNEDHYEKAFCNEVSEGRFLIAFQNEKSGMVKILRPDTLSVENALGKVWYDKSDQEVEFFNSFGKHPENGKTLKQATKYIIRKYGKQETLE